uniref:Uncharacterized protein n=1 Tax=Brassica campestris TaxID=3711 RepID=M4D8C6_BRACM
MKPESFIAISIGSPIPVTWQYDSSLRQQTSLLRRQRLVLSRSPLNRALQASLQYKCPLDLTSSSFTLVASVCSNNTDRTMELYGIPSLCC